ncbi:MAG: ABC-type transport auxiliary lipoprotein family protein [Dokdonella sp.]
MNALQRFTAVGFVLALTGCGSLLNVQRTPFTIYSPRYTAAASPGPSVNWQLIVETPLSSDTLDSARIQVMPTPGVLEVLPAARWRDSTPAMLRGLIVQGFEQSGRIVGVGSASSGMRADFALAVELRDFQLEMRAGGPHAVVRFQARLLDYSSNRVLAAHAFTADVPAAGTEAASAFTAFEMALNTVIPELVDWTLAEGSRPHKRAPPA